MARSYKNLAAFVGTLWVLLVFGIFITPAHAQTVGSQVDNSRAIYVGGGGSQPSSAIGANFATPLLQTNTTYDFGWTVQGATQGVATTSVNVTINSKSIAGNFYVGWCGVTLIWTPFTTYYYATSTCASTNIDFSLPSYISVYPSGVSNPIVVAGNSQSSPFFILTIGNDPLMSFPAFSPTQTAIGVATTSTNSFCDQNVPFDNSSIIQATLTAVPNGLCKVGAFMVIPSGNTLGQYALLSSSTQEKIPFSYFYDVQSLITGAATSTSQNSQTFAMNLGALDFSSSTAMGPLLPTSLTFFSSTTIGQYMSPATHDLLYNLMIYAIWLEVMWLIYHKIVPTRAKI